VIIMIKKKHSSHKQLYALVGYVRYGVY